MSERTGVTVSYDRRSDTLERFTVWEKVVTFALESGDTTGIAIIPINGLLQKILVKVPNMQSGSGSLDVSLTDNDDSTIWSVTNLSDSLTHPYSVSEPLAHEVNVILGFTNPGQTVIVVVTLRGV